MNYLAEINAFERRMRRRPLPVVAQLLWYKLIQHANRQFWPEWFYIENDALGPLVNSSCSTARVARTQLLDEGYILYEAGTKSHPGAYRLLSVAEREQLVIAGGDWDDYDPESPEPEESFFEVEPISESLTQEQTDELRDTLDQLFKRYLPGTTLNEADLQWGWSFLREKDDEGRTTFPLEKKKLLAYAFEQAAISGAVNWNYIKGIYRNFRQRNITTSEQAILYDFERDQEKEGL